MTDKEIALGWRTLFFLETLMHLGVFEDRDEIVRQELGYLCRENREALNQYPKPVTL